MLDRVQSLLPVETNRLWGGTFHSIGNRILRRHAERAGFRPGFSIMDREDQKDLLDAVIGVERARHDAAIAFPKPRCWARSSRSRTTRATGSRKIVDGALSLLRAGARRHPHGCAQLYTAKKLETNSWTSTTCWRRRCACSRSTTICSSATSGSSSSSSWTSIRTPTRSRRTYRHCSPATGREPHGRRRRRAEHLLVARRELQEHPRVPEALSATRRSTRSRRTTAACRRS